MGTEKIPSAAGLVMGVLWRDDEAQEAARDRVKELFGPVHGSTQTVNFSAYTEYYDAEMGSGIKRCFYSFERLLPRGGLVEAKLSTNRIERNLAEKGRRTVNLDPGMVAEESLVLATCKPYAHRIYLGKGIFGDLALIYSKGSFEPLPWTYPDYREEWAREFFLGVRRAVMGSNRNG